ncbi:hypothetical protein [Micromonospora radicis]|uniref:Uncharacterized protein n=1 Tax=Micromonospora radicis TaxID=1894971 RepID=A0A418MPJ2_9ACTN|nr:hypothetical protein [Micromonospora radicis]RIV34372.1 hypothetical protein D2L64_22990 [Micromonospora radicis]
MTDDRSIPRQDDRSDGSTVMQWGAEPEEATETGRLRRAVSGFHQDHRVPLLLAGLGAVAALASLLGEWVTVTLPTGGAYDGTPVEMPSNVSEIGGLGIGYLVGLLVLGATAALALRGTAPVRPNARVAGLALAVGLLAVLAATAISLQDDGRRTYANADGIDVELGRGLVMAFVAVLLFAAALARSAAGSDGPDGEPGRRRTRPRRIEADDSDDDRPPIEITVAPAVPFAREAHPD